MATSTIHAYDFATPVECVRAAKTRVVPARIGDPAHTLTIKGGSDFCAVATVLQSVPGLTLVHRESSGPSRYVYRGMCDLGHYSLVLEAGA